MAQTKRKRQTNPRGTAAGLVVAGGRTGRKPTEQERKRDTSSAQKRVDRLDRPPTWRSAANRGGIAAAFFGLIIVLLFGQSISAGISLAALMCVMYIPMTYYTDLFVYRRRQRKKAA
jgi:hypothetical protein